MRVATFSLVLLLVASPALAAPETDKAFLAAFGHAAPYKSAKFTYTPSGLVTVAPGIVALISGGKGCDSCVGALAIHYLKRSGQEFSLLKAWPAIGTGAAWALRRDLDSVPVILATHAEGGQDCRQTFSQVIALMPDHPVLQAKLLMAALSDPGPEPDHSPGYRVTAKIVPEERGKRFALQYSGTWKLQVEYRRKGDLYAAQGQEAPSCQ